MNGSDEVMEDIKPAGDMKGVEAAEEKVEAKADTRGEKLFSSDDFKIEVQNLPKYFGVGQLKKLFNNKLKLNTHKLKVRSGSNLQTEMDWNVYISYLPFLSC